MLPSMKTRIWESTNQGIFIRPRKSISMIIRTFTVISFTYLSSCKSILQNESLTFNYMLKNMMKQSKLSHNYYFLFQENTVKIILSILRVYLAQMHLLLCHLNCRNCGDVLESKLYGLLLSSKINDPRSCHVVWWMYQHFIVTYIASSMGKGGKGIEPLFHNKVLVTIVGDEIWLDNSRGFKVFYNRRYFLNFRRYLKN